LIYSSATVGHLPTDEKKILMANVHLLADEEFGAYCLPHFWALFNIEEKHTKVQ
jgi:hypothetical protein